MEILIDSAKYTGKATRTTQGFLSTPAVIAAAGIVSYPLPGGGVRREYRPPSEVLNADSVASYKNAPITNGHPLVFPPLVTSKNARELSVGMLGGDVKADAAPDRCSIGGDVVVMDEQAIVDATMNGKSALSPGYTRDLEMKSGVVGDELPAFKGQSYDGIQRNIRCNHIALCFNGRQGPKVRLNLDDTSEEDSVFVCDSVELDDKSQEGRMKTIKIGGKSYEVADEVAARIDSLEKAGTEALDQLKESKVEADTLKKDSEKMKTDAADQKKALDTAQARIDSTAKELKDLKAATDSKDTPASLKERVKARVRIISVARIVLPKDHKLTLDTLDDVAIMREVISADDADAVLTDKSADYIQARFDAIVSGLGDRLDEEEKVGTILGEGRGEVRTDAESKLEEARRKSQEKLFERYKKPIKA